MSWARFGDGSDVYVYPAWSVGGYGIGVCCGCWLGEQDFVTRDVEAMVAHLEEHRSAGHEVPAHTDAEMRAEWDMLVLPEEDPAP